MSKPIHFSQADSHSPWMVGSATAASLPARDRAAGVHGRTQVQAVLTLLARLERLHESDMSAQQRIALLMLLEPQIEPLAIGLAKPVVPPRQSDDARKPGPSLEQRLYLLAAKNLARGIEALDQSPQAFSDEAANQRWWLVKHLLRALARTVEYCFRWDRAWPPEVWERSHDLYFYLNARPDLRLGRGYDRGARVLDPQTEYKRLLLLGLAHDQVPPEARAAVLAGPLREWAEQSRLRDPGGYEGAFGIYVVEIARDHPPWEYPVALASGFRGWVLEPAPSFLHRIRALAGGEAETTAAALPRLHGAGASADDLARARPADPATRRGL